MADDELLVRRFSALEVNDVHELLELLDRDAPNPALLARLMSESHFVPSLMELVGKNDADTAVLVVEIMCRICEASLVWRDQLLMHDSKLPARLMEGAQLNMGLMRAATILFVQFTRPPMCTADGAYSKLLPQLANLIFIVDEQSLINALAALIPPASAMRQATIECGVTRRVVELTMHANPTVKVHALEIMTGFAEGSDLHKQMILNCSALPCLLACLAPEMRGSSESVREMTMRCVYAVSQGNDWQRQALLDSNVTAAVVGALNWDNTMAVRLAIESLCHLFAGSTYKPRDLESKYGAMEKMLVAVRRIDDETTILHVLEALKEAVRSDPKFVLQDVDGVRALLDHPVYAVREAASHVFDD